MLLAPGGCGTILNLEGFNGDRPPTPYGGTMLDGAITSVGVRNALGLCPKGDELDSPLFILLGWCALGDLPLSLLADTVTLPVVLSRDSSESGKRPDSLQGDSSATGPAESAPPGNSTK